jgi:nucleotide-binding universal stress UspA family protein
VFSSIVVGTDGSETATHAVREAVEVAKSVGATLQLVSAFSSVPEPQLRAEAREVPPDMRWAVHPRRAVEAALSDAASLAQAEGVEANTYAREADPADAILDVAEEQKADLIVVGNKGMAGKKRFLLGSVPDKISHHAPCSVMIIRTT